MRQDNPYRNLPSVVGLVMAAQWEADNPPDVSEYQSDARMILSNALRTDLPATSEAIDEGADLDELEQAAVDAIAALLERADR